MEHCLKTSRGKTHEKNLCGFCHFLEVASLYLCDIAQDCSLGQCLTSSRSETSKKYFVAKIGAEMIFSILVSSIVHSNLLVTNVMVRYISNIYFFNKFGTYGETGRKIH